MDAYTISGPRLPPAAGREARSLVVLLHGWGADGDDLITMAPHWGQLMRDTAFVSPHAPFPCDMGHGRQWFSLADRTPAMLLARLKAVVPVVNVFIEAELAALGLGPERLALIGFSQGTMLSLYLAPRRAPACAAVLGYSGALLGGETLSAEVTARPPVMLIHGEADSMVPSSSMAQAKESLEAVGFKVESHLRPGLGHGIDSEGLALGGRFLAEALANAGRRDVVSLAVGR